jgi:hypothetical protein
MSIDQNTTVAPPAAVLPNPQPAGNPLSKFFRQPAIYITLPSGGRFWADGALEMPENGELPVFPLTSKDEIMLRTPDALMNGQAVVEVIQSCIPNIKNAWSMPSIDTDTVLIAIRIASYGHSMDFNHTCAKCGEEHSYGMDLRHLSETIRMPDYDTPVEQQGLRVVFRPSTYKEITHLNQISYEINRQTQAIDANQLNNEERAGFITTTMQRVVDMGQEALINSTVSIEDIASGTVTSDRNFIAEFYSNIDRRMFNSIQEALIERTKDANIKPQDTTCQNCGAPITLSILFDYSNFFVVGS